jgi:subtilisin family serine protease
VKQRARVINLSWAVGIDKQRAIHDAIDNAPNVLFVVAAGNSGADNDKYPTVPADYGRHLSNVITVMATDDFDDKPGFSNYGDTTVHIAAPGMRVISTHSYLSAAAQPGNLVSYQRYDGTSPAAAYVAGAAALLKSQDPSLLPRDIRDVLIATADHRSDLRCVARGRLNVKEALDLVQAHLRVPPLPVPSGNRPGYSRPPGGTTPGTRRGRGAGPASPGARGRAARTARRRTPRGSVGPARAASGI